MKKMKKNKESHSHYSSISRTSSVYFRCSMPTLQNCLFLHKFFSIFSSIWNSSISVDQDHALWGVNCFTPARTPPPSSLESPAPPHHQLFQTYTTCQVSFLSLTVSFPSFNLYLCQSRPAHYSSDSLNPSTEEASNSPPTIQRPVCF